jgi:hypothetical protein
MLEAVCETTNQHSSLAASKILNPDQGYYVGVVKNDKNGVKSLEVYSS